jgi:hypothetical protein
MRFPSGYVVAALAACVAFAFLASHFMRHSEAGSDATRKRFARLERDIEQLARTRSAPARTETVLAKPVRTQAAPLESVRSSPEGPEARDPEVARAKVDEAWNRIPDFLQKRFDDESFERGWSTERELRIAQGIASLSTPHGTFESVECRTTLCRLDGRFDSVDAFNQIMQDMLTPAEKSSFEVVGRHGHVQRGAFETDADGSVRAVVYMFREGKTFDMLQTLNE